MTSLASSILSKLLANPHLCGDQSLFLDSMREVSESVINSGQSENDVILNKGRGSRGERDSEGGRTSPNRSVTKTSTWSHPPSRNYASTTFMGGNNTYPPTTSNNHQQQQQQKQQQHGSTSQSSKVVLVPPVVIPNHHLSPLDVKEERNAESFAQIRKQKIEAIER